jgi:hypothetical protein
MVSLSKSRPDVAHGGTPSTRDIIQTSLLVDARYLTLAVQLAYRHKTGGKEVTVQSYRDTRNLLDAIYASNRLQLPLDGILLIGYSSGPIKQGVAPRSCTRNGT